MLQILKVLKPKKIKPWRRISGLCLLVMLLAVIWTLCTETVGRYRVISGSMKPTLEIGDFVLADQRNSYQPKRDDIIVFRDPDNSTDRLTKRIIGLPGDHVVLEDERIIIADVFQYDVPSWKMRVSPYRNQNFQLAEDEVFLLGDNRDNSHDSLYFGPVQKDLIVGKVVFIYWPVNHLGLINSVEEVKAKELELHTVN